MTDADDQSDELLALTSIYGEAVISCQKDCTQSNVGTLRVNVELRQPFHVRLNSHDVDHEVQHLPPIVLSFSLPSDYPSASPPQYSVACPWLTTEQLKRARHELDTIWSDNSGSVILFMWMNFLQNDLFDLLALSSPLSVAPEALAAILEHDRTARKRIFDVTVFPCSVCLSEKVGSACIQFDGCNHVFCRTCTRDYLSIQITDGSVTELHCPAPKCQTRVMPGQVKELVTADLYERYDRLLLQRTLDMMSDVQYCPRQACHCPVLIDERDAMGSCPSCHYVFCIYCKMTYHGVSPCRIMSENMKEIRDAYMAASDAEKKRLEQRYGRKNIRRLVEDSFSNEWVNENCKKCPRCSTQIQKIDGCNKMSCTKCHAYFCWLCLAVINATNPYAHFNAVSSSCYNKLFQGVDVDAFDERDNFLEDFDDDEDFEDFDDEEEIGLNLRFV